MKTRHNKKRNTAFIYESLIVEATVSVLKKDTERQDKAVNIIKKYFNTDSILRKDLQCYRSLYKEQDLDEKTCRRIINEARVQQKLINPTGLFNAQTELINDINKQLSPSVFNNFVPNYKYLATISQLFSIKTSPKSLVILENKIIEDMQTKNYNSDNKTTDVIDTLVLNKFVEKFNDKYESDLLTEQKDLLTNYIVSFSDNGLGLKSFLNEEISRLKSEISNITKKQKTLKNDAFSLKLERVYDKLESFAKIQISEDIVKDVFYIQDLLNEVNNNDNS